MPVCCSGPGPRPSCCALAPNLTLQGRWTFHAWMTASELGAAETAAAMVVGEERGGGWGWREGRGERGEERGEERVVCGPKFLRL